MENYETPNCVVVSEEDQLAPLIRGNSSSVSTSTGTTGTKIPRRHLPGKQSKIHVTLCILITELCERLTFYGITANLVPFCHDMLNLATPLPSTINLVFQGTCYLIPVVGGWLADSYMGRFNVIYGSSLIYLVGTILLSTVSLTNDLYSKYFGGTSTFWHNPKARLVYFVLALFFLAFGTGGIKANVSPFGADQVREEGPGAIQRFFNWFYWFINIGSFVSFTLVVWVQQEQSFFLGYTITACSMFLGVLTFVIGRNSYTVHPPGGSNLADSFKVIGLAIKRKMKKHAKLKGESWLDLAKDSRGGRFSATQVEDVKALLRILPVFAMFVIYWTLYSQMQTTYLIQAQYMKIHLGFNLPAASLSIFDIVSVLLLIPFMDKVVYPLLRYIGIKFTPLRRIGVGMIFAAASVAVAGCIEIKRRGYYESGDITKQNLFHKKFNASDMTVFYQVPQFILIGTSEVFTSITGLEFAYSQAPRCLQGLVMGIFLVTSGLGNFLSSALTNIVYHVNPKWYPEDPNTGHLEYYFFLLSGLMFVNFLIFIIVACNYKYVDHRRTRHNVASNLDSSRSNSKSLDT